MATEPTRGLLIDWGGVLTTDLFASFRAFCVDEGLEPDTVVKRFAGDSAARELLIGLETGTLTETDFERRLGALLEVDPAALIDRMFRRVAPDEAMIEAVRRAHRAGIRTGLISNSWGTRHYDRAMLGELFDGVVISGEEGLRKPAPQLYTLGAERAGVEPAACVYVDDLAFNLAPAAELGMATVRHVRAAETIPELERRLGVALR